VSVDSGVSGPVEGPGVAAPTRGGSARSTSRLGPRRGVAAADALADAISTPSFRTGRGRPRRRGRRATRIVRRIELWSVLKIALVFNTILLGVVLGSVALLWGLANTTGLVDDLEGFLRDAGFEDFRFQGERMFEQVAFIGAVGALAATVFMVLATALLNLIAEITGGIKFVVIEEIVEPPAPAAAPPAPLALPTVPTAPPYAPAPPAAPLAPPPEPSPPTAAPPTPPGPRLNKPDPGPTTPAPYDVDRDEDDAPAPPRSRRPAKTAAKKATAKKAPARKRPAKKAAAKKASASRPPARGGSEGQGPSGGRRVRRQDASSGSPAEARPADDADDTSA
jgi:hypothetical protein